MGSIGQFQPYKTQGPIPKGPVVISLSIVFGIDLFSPCQS